ncbi:hypothetical protein [Antarcticirhabdus aurantiaca]|uniref:Uncharacterized protein n=1 Tax=Antarcticirhabdus aurantiaca TaxID=2606717 RepID=A0ACD4NRN6_9HYPH|nr:hypothetical protein OXU80_03470 [Jeongeuplla avenae]
MILFLLPGGVLVATEGVPTRRVPPAPRPPGARDASLRAAGLDPARANSAPHEAAVRMAGDMIDIVSLKGDCTAEDLHLRGWPQSSIRKFGEAATELAHGKAGTAR